MHQSSLWHMKDIVSRFVGSPNKKISVLDIGSYDVNGSYKPIFLDISSKYIGLDLEGGPNVDLVLKSPYKFPIKSKKFDLVVSGQAFEHIEYFWLTWLEMVRVTKSDGLIFLIAPSRGPEHRHPQDCWRFYPDGYRALAKLGKCDLLEVTADWQPHPSPDSAQWGDCVGVFRKRKPTILQMLSSLKV